MKNLFFTLVFSLCTLLVQAQITTTTTPSGLIKVGTPIPEMTLKTMDGASFDFKKEFQNQPLVIIFYRANWCPYCNEHLSDLQDYEKQFIKLGYKVVAISTEAPDQLKTTKIKTFAKYLLLSDEEKEAIKLFGVENGAIAVPSVFISDKDQTIRFVHSDPNYKVRLSGAEVLENAKQIIKM